MNEVWKENALRMFDEAYTQLEYEQTWFKDNRPHSSLIPAFAHLTAEQASRAPACGRYAAARHAAHLAASLEGAIRAYRGGPYEVDWEGSWDIPDPLSEAEWDALRDRLTRAYGEIRELIAANDDWTEPIRSLSVLALLAHSAYHLGAISQIASEWLAEVGEG